MPTPILRKASSTQPDEDELGRDESTENSLAWAKELKAKCGVAQCGTREICGAVPVRVSGLQHDVNLTI